MLIDWFTIVAQIINFLILVYLLKRLLYGPILAAMRAREQRVVARLLEADQRHHEAEQARQEYRERQLALDQQREAFLSEARQSAEERRQELLRASHEEIATLKTNWQAAIRREEAAFLRALRRRAGAQVVDVARRMLSDLADAELEQRMIAVFLQRVRRLAPDERAALERTLAESPQRVTIQCAFPLAPHQREEIGRALGDLIGTDLELRVATVPDLICGISLLVGGREIAWNIQSYLETLEEEIAQVLSAASAPAETEHAAA